MNSERIGKTILKIHAKKNSENQSEIAACEQKATSTKSN